MNFFREMKWRGLVSESTPGLEQLLQSEPLTGYVGFDPTASSLHVGSLIQIMSLSRLQRAGHTPIAIAGGGTGLIGDPSGKASERSLLSKEEVAENLEGIAAQLGRFLDFEARENRAVVVNNLDWLGDLALIDFLRDIGKYFSVNAMIQKTSVKSRMDSEEGVSFTEFSYQLLQGYDFLELNKRYGCRLQMGGTDQWGNIVGGIDLIRRLRRVEAHGLCTPLLTTAAGAKFGKTEAGTVWLDAERTSPYQFYQFWLNSEDGDVVRLLKLFTFLGEEEIGELGRAVLEDPERREAQRALAREVTGMTHGHGAMVRAEGIAERFFSGSLANLSADEVLDAVGDVPVRDLPATELEGEGVPLIDLLVRAGLSSSKSEARRSVEGGGIYLLSERVRDPGYRVTARDGVEGKILLLRRGRKNYFVVRILK